jgi:hypothetical protein
MHPTDSALFEKIRTSTAELFNADPADLFTGILRGVDYQLSLVESHMALK